MSDQYKITDEQKKLLLQISAQTLPDNPSREGYSAEQIRGRLYRPYAALIDLINGVFNSTYTDVSQIQEDIKSGNIYARGIVPWNSTYTYGANEITFYPNIGEFGAFVKSVQTGNTGNDPYLNGTVNSAWWTEVVNFNNIAEDYFQEVKAAASAAQSSATAAAQSASNATGSATQARQYATAAGEHANAASGSAEQAASSAGAAAGSATAAGQSASAAEQSATQAEQNASAAATSAGQAAQSASAAQASADRAQQIVDGIGDVYTPVGSIPYAQLPATPSQAERGYVYNITDSFTTDSRFVEGAGLQYAAGTNVAVVLNGSQYMYDVLGGMVDLSNYAQINGTYPNMSVGKATSDGDGNNIAATYAKQSGTYPNLTAGSAQKVAPAGLINSGAKIWWRFLHVQYSGGSAGYAVLNEVFLVNGLLDYFESSDTYTEAAALLQLKAVYLPQTNAWKEYSLVYLDGDIPYTRFCVYADAEGLHVSQYGTQSEMNLVPLSSQSSGFTVSYVGGPATPPEERKEPEVLLPMLNGATRVYTYNGSDFTAQVGDSYIIDEPNIVTGGNTLAVGDLVQDSSGTILRLTTVNDGSGLAIGTVLGHYIPYYLKPRTGIPKSHLAQAVQDSLDKADTALQVAPVTSVNGQTGDVVINTGSDPEAVKFVQQTLTAEQQEQARTNIGAYNKPSSGIPKSDLAQDVQSSLDRADSALTEVPIASEGIPGLVKPVTKDISMTQNVGVDAEGRLFTKPLSAEYQPSVYKATGDLSNTIGGTYLLSDYQISPNPANIKAGDLVYDNSGRIARFTNNYDGTDINSAITLYISGDYATKSEVNAKYTKPNGGIPKSDLAQTVQDSLGKADTALQSAPVTSVAGKTGAVTLAKGDVGLSNVDNVQQYSASNPPPYPVSSVNGLTGAVTLSAADVKAATTTQVNETSMVPDSGNATNLTVPESGGRVEIEADGWLCVNISKTTANGQFVTMIVQTEDGKDKWGCVNKSTTYFQNNYPAEFLPVKKGDYVRISYNITPSRIQLIRSKQV